MRPDQVWTATLLDRLLSPLLSLSLMVTVGGGHEPHR